MESLLSGMHVPPIRLRVLSLLLREECRMKGIPVAWRMTLPVRGIVPRALIIAWVICGRSQKM
jgi:hypothetical protein